VNGEDLGEHHPAARVRRRARGRAGLIFVSGDVSICDIARAANPAAHTAVATNNDSVVALLHQQTGGEQIA
jgi:hypothetical protein